MNTEHLGNVYDFAKRDILRALKEEFGGKTYVLPMFTNEFDEEQLSFYKHLTSADKIKTEVIQYGNRGNYFTNVDADYDIIFIDPDTGIRDRNEDKYVRYDEIKSVSSSYNLIVVYDQSFSHNEEKINAIREKIEEFGKRQLFACYINLSRQLAVAIISQSKRQLDRAKQVLVDKEVVFSPRLISYEEISDSLWEKARKRMRNFL